LKKSLLTGLVIVLPLVLTAIVAFFLFDLFTTPFVPLVRTFLSHFFKTLPEEITVIFSRLIGLILLILLIFFLGFITRHFFFDTLMNWGNRIVYRIPFVKTVYKLTRDIFSALFSPDGKKVFRETVIVPFPQKPHYCIGFTAGEVPKECQEKAGRTLVSVFTPTAPHPISGFLFLVPEENVFPIKMSKEDALKYLVSCGVVHPETKKT